MLNQKLALILLTCMWWYHKRGGNFIRGKKKTSFVVVFYFIWRKQLSSWKTINQKIYEPWSTLTNLLVSVFLFLCFLLEQFHINQTIYEQCSVVVKKKKTQDHKELTAKKRHKWKEGDIFLAIKIQDHIKLKKWEEKGHTPPVHANSWQSSFVLPRY
jgi:hypothetical protein